MSTNSKKKNFSPHQFAHKRTEGVYYNVGGVDQSAKGGWYRGDTTNFRPPKSTYYGPDSIEKYILEGWLPEQPFITPETKIVTFGSCFAGNIARYLSEGGYNLLGKDVDEDEHSETFQIFCNEGIVNTHTMRQIVEWIFLGIPPNEPVWHGGDAEQFDTSEKAREYMRAVFEQAETFIMTVGLSEVWYSKETGTVFSRAIPKDMFDEEKHGFRVTSVAENIENLRAIYDVFRKHRPDAKMIITLSPVPLVATFRPVSCISANSVSKAVLRAAVDEFYREVESEGTLHYWPSYEIVLEGFTESFKDDARHVREPILNYIMSLFEKHYCTREITDSDLVANLFEARISAGEFPFGTKKALTYKSSLVLNTLISWLIRKYRFGLANLLIERAQIAAPELVKADKHRAAVAAGIKELNDRHRSEHFGKGKAKKTS